MKQFLRWLVSLVLPSRCPFCSDLVEKEGEYCRECREELPICRTYTLTPNAKRGDLLCMRAPYYYGGSARRAALALKFYNHRSAAVCFAQAMARLEQVTGLVDADFVTAVPLSKKRLQQRGYNQSELIARQYALFKGMHYVETMEKHKHVAKQSLQIGASARMANVKGCYRVIDEDAVRNKSIVLIDDVYTSGATMRECARTLRRAGARCVIGLSGCTSGKKRR